MFVLGSILYICQRILETDPMGTLQGLIERGRVEREGSIFTILYHHCPKCRASHVITKDGPVEVDAGVVERVEGEAERVEIKPEEEMVMKLEKDPGALDSPPPPPLRGVDRPTPAPMARKVILRDGDHCANPHCRRKLGLHAHHVHWRNRGGRTEIWNLLCVCSLCHAGVHRGVLTVEGNPVDGLRWIPRLQKLDLKLELEREELEKVPVVVVQAAEQGEGGGLSVRKSVHNKSVHNVDSQDKDSKDFKFDFEGYAAGLKGLGYTMAVARERVRGAYERLKELGRQISEEEILKEALRFKENGPQRHVG